MPIFLKRIIQHLEGDEEVPELKELERQLGIEVLRSALYGLLDWLRAFDLPQIGPRPLRLQPDRPWCQALARVAASTTGFDEVFKVASDRLEFSPSVGELRRSQIKAEVRSSYRPILFESESAD